MPDVPSGWSQQAIEKIAETFSGGTPPRSQPEFYGGTIPWVKSGEVNQTRIRSSDEYITEEGFKNSSARWAPPGCTLIAMYGATAGKVARLDIKAAINQAICAVIGNPSVADDAYLTHALTHAAPKLLRRTQGSGQPNLSGALIRSLELPIPPLPEQRKIAAILSSVDETIEKTEAVIDQLEVVKKGLLGELLTRGIPGRHEEFRDTEIGPLPTQWRVIRLGEVLRYQNGKAFPSSNYCDTGVALVRPGNLAQDGVVVWDEGHTTYLPESHADANPTFMVGEGEVLMNLTAQSLEDGFLGRVCRTPAGTRCLLNQRIARIVPLAGISPQFAFWVLAGPQFRAHVDRIPNGSKVKHIYNRNLDEALLPVPPADEQNSIASALDEMVARILVTRAKLGAIMEVRSALLDALLSGRIRVSPHVEVVA